MSETDQPRVRVMRNPLRRNDQPWFVVCGFCAGGSDFLGFGGLGAAIAFGGPGRLGYAPDWRTAQDFAQHHVHQHIATQCPTCQHIPAKPLAKESA